MKRLFFLYALLALVGCTHDEIEKFQSSASDEYYATFEGDESRTYVDNQIRMRWTAEDKITLFKKNTYNRTFMFTGKTGANAGGFKQTSVDDEYWFGMMCQTAMLSIPILQTMNWMSRIYSLR